MFPYFVLGTVFILLAAIIYITGAFSSPRKIEDDYYDYDNLNSHHDFSNASYIDYSSFMNKNIRSANHSYAFSLPVSILS